jgi:hypothetical protein
MPYIRLYSREVSLEEKRSLAGKLIAITLNALKLRPEERDRITIQFIPRCLSPRNVDELFRSEQAAAVLEVSDRDLTPRKINAFVDAATPILSQSAVVGRSRRIARVLGIAPEPSRQIAFQFNQTSSPATNAKRDKSSAWAPPIAA